MTGRYDYRSAKGWLRPEEREYLKHIAGAVVYRPATVIVNIGTEYGASLVCFREGNIDAIIYGIDINIEPTPKDLDVHLIEGNSALLWQEGIDEWFETDFDILFVDGDHEYEGVRADTLYTKRVRIGGYAIFHDCYDYAHPYIDGHPVTHRVVPGVNLAVEQWYSRNDIGCWDEQGPVGTMRIFKRLSCV